MRAFQLLSVCLLVFCAALPAHAQNDQLTSPQVTKKKKATATKKQPAEISEQRKKQILAFVNEHHPELNELLEQLENKGKKKRAWLSAMNGLNRAIKKLEAIKERNPDRYETALELWNLESRIKLTSAQLKLKDTKEGRAKLESLIGKQVDFHINRARKSRDQVKKQLDVLNKRISDAESNRQQQIEKKFKATLPKKAKKDKAD